MISGTFLLYLSIFISTTLLVTKAQKLRQDGSVTFSKGMLFFSFVIHWFFIAFTRIGADHNQYVDIIMYKADYFLERGEDPGFNMMCIFLRKYIGNPEIIIFIFKTITISLYYQTFWLLRDRANMFFVILPFNCKLYLWGFTIIAQSMAVAFVILATALLIRKCKWYWPVLFSIIAASIHLSAFILAFAFVLIAFLNKGKIGKKSIYLLAALSIIITYYIVHNIQFILTNLANEVEGFGQYAAYEEVMHTGGGLFNYIFYIYLCTVIIIPFVKNTSDRFYRNATIVLFILGFVFAISGYFIGSYRLNYYTYTLFLVVFPLLFFEENNFKAKNGTLFSLKFQKITWSVFLFYTGIETLLGATSPNSLSDIYNYSLFNPFL